MRIKYLSYKKEHLG